MLPRPRGDVREAVPGGPWLGDARRVEDLPLVPAAARSQLVA
jgi:hypothetical protein